MFKIKDGREQFYQWDKDRQLIVEDAAITEVHFCNRTDNCSLVVKTFVQDGLTLANVPNILLTTSWRIRAYAYDGSHTKHEKCFEVNGRSKPADYVYTETEVRTLDYLEDKVEEIEAMAKGAVSGKSFMNYKDLVEALNEADNTTYSQSQHFLIQTLGVPDLWVYRVSDRYVAYKYTNDEVIATATTIGTLQIGYYILSALETQKVDLTDYVRNTDYADTGEYGLVKLGGDSKGLNLDTDGKLIIKNASPTDIDNKASAFKPIVPYRLDYATMKALTNPKNHTWTEAQKTAARNTLGAVGDTDYATNSKGGVIKTDSRYGSRMINGILDIIPAVNTEIDNRTIHEEPINLVSNNNRHSITPATLDYAVKSVLSNPKIEMTDNEKESARTWLGITEKLTTVEEIARGRTKGYVFDYYEDLDNWLYYGKYIYTDTEEPVAYYPPSTARIVVETIEERDSLERYIDLRVYVKETKTEYTYWDGEWRVSAKPVSREIEQADLKPGDNLYIREKDTPDYWWTGTDICILETSVDLSGVAFKEEVQEVGTHKFWTIELEEGKKLKIITTYLVADIYVEEGYTYFGYSRSNIPSYGGFGMISAIYDNRYIYPDRGFNNVISTWRYADGSVVEFKVRERGEDEDVVIYYGTCQEIKGV